MGLRKRAWCVIVLLALGASIACTVSRAYVTSTLLLTSSLFAVWRLRQPNYAPGELTDWCMALEGKDPFNPDAKPSYAWQGVATTFVVALRVTKHPTLTGKTLLVFRDEVDEDTWRALVTRIRHGAHTIAQNRNWFA
jgi:hypothetical protein